MKDPDETCPRCSHPHGEHSGINGSCTHPMPRRTVCPCTTKRRIA